MERKNYNYVLWFLGKQIENITVFRWISNFYNRSTKIEFGNVHIIRSTFGGRGGLVICYETLKNNRNFTSLRGVVVDLSGLRDRGPGFKTRSRPSTFMKADTNFRTLHVVGFSCINEFCWIPSCKTR
jgi:hypothetical protein